MRYSPPDSPINVAVAVNGGGLRIRVTYKGPWMSQDELAMLGMPYYRAKSSLGKRGSGLGYHFTRGIIEAHSGKLTASLLPGGGMEVAIEVLVQGWTETSTP